MATDPAERAARCTFVVVGAGYTGTEVTAHGQLLTTRLARALPGLAGQEIRWLLLDLAPRVLAELDPRLSKTAERVLRRRGVEVLTGESVAKAVDGSVQLTTGDKVVTRSLIWCVGSPGRPAGGRPGPGHQPGTAGGRRVHGRARRPRASTRAGTAPRYPT